MVEEWVKMGGKSWSPGLRPSPSESFVCTLLFQKMQKDKFLGSSSFEVGPLLVLTIERQAELGPVPNSSVK